FPELAKTQFVEDHAVDHGTLGLVWNGPIDSTPSERARVDRSRHRPVGTQDGNLGEPSPARFLGHNFANVQSRQGKWLARGFERDVRCIVRTKEKIGSGGGEL